MRRSSNGPSQRGNQKNIIRNKICISSPQKKKFIHFDSSMPDLIENGVYLFKFYPDFFQSH